MGVRLLCVGRWSCAVLSMRGMRNHKESVSQTAYMYIRFNRNTYVSLFSLPRRYFIKCCAVGARPSSAASYLFPPCSSGRPPRSLRTLGPCAGFRSRHLATPRLLASRSTSTSGQHERSDTRDRERDNSTGFYTRVVRKKAKKQKSKRRSNCCHNGTYAS